MDKIISIKNLCFDYTNEETEEINHVLKGVSLDINKGEFVAVLGHNGSGKSTLAKHLNVILVPTSGSVTVDGLDTSDEKNLFEIRRRVGMVFQNPDNQMVANIVEEDVAFAPENLGVPREEIRARVDNALAAVNMSRFAKHAPHMLSGGQKQRIAIAGVLAMRRKCIIFDESTAMLDPGGRKEVMDTICRLNREEGITVIHITHYMNEATMADRVLVMNEGSVIMDGTPSEVFSRADELWEAGLDVPQTTELLWKMKEAGYDVRLDIFEPEECAKEISRVLHGKS